MTTVKLGTRASKLALAQAHLVAEALSTTAGYDVELVEIATKGDTSSAPLTSIGGTGVFVSALREALLDERIDIAVHSLKDLPTGAADGLSLAAVPSREDPRDALCARDGLKLADLPTGARVGTGAPRRVAQIRALRSDLDVVPVRGNVDTRLGKVDDGNLDAVILARAGLVRLGRDAAVTETLDVDAMLPAPGQGALAVECRTGDARADEIRASLDDTNARAAVTAERSLLAELEAGCTAPIGAHAEVTSRADIPPTAGNHRQLYLRAAVISEDGTKNIRKSAAGTIGEAAELGRSVARELLAAGAGAMVGAPSGASKEEKVP